MNGSLDLCLRLLLGNELAELGLHTCQFSIGEGTNLRRGVELGGVDLGRAHFECDEDKRRRCNSQVSRPFGWMANFQVASGLKYVCPRGLIRGPMSVPVCEVISTPSVRSSASPPAHHERLHGSPTKWWAQVQGRRWEVGMRTIWVPIRG